MALLLLILSTLALAHPFGSELYGHRLEVRLSGRELRLDYLAEISTLDHLRDLRGFAAHSVADDPRPLEERHVERVLDELQGGLKVLADGERLELRRLPASEPSGRGDTRFVSFHLSLLAMLPADARQLNVINTNLPGKPALFHTRLLVTDEVQVDACSLFEVVDGRLARDWSDQWMPREDARELRVSFRRRGEAGAALSRGFRRLAAGGPVDEHVDAALRLSGVHPDPLLELVRGQVSPASVALGLVTAVVLGILHGLSPGHGKALVAAWLVGSRRKIRHAFALGGVVTLTHTAAVFVLGALALLLADTFAPERILPWMELASGGIILVVGVGLVRRRWPGLRQAVAESTAAAGYDAAHAHDHGHAHAHDHGHAHAHDHGHAHGHDHAHDHLDDAAHARAHAAELERAAEGWRGLVALGVSGGLVPCPSALVLLLTAIGLQRIGLGLVLVTAFSLGLALLVSGIGVTAVLLGDRVQAHGGSSRVLRALPALSAIVVVGIGLLITWRGGESVWRLLEGA